MENQLKSLNDRRYVVGYAPIITNTTQEKTVVFVVDKWSHRIVYKSVVKDRQKAYPSIQRMYDKDNCIPPKPLIISLFE